MRRILVIEDDETIRLAIREVLALEGFQVLLAEDGDEGLSAACREDPDAILLDIVLPHRDGYEVLRRLRADGIETPVLMISAKGQEIDKVLALELGADDYLTKPFGLAELTARIKAQLRRAQMARGRSPRGSRKLGPFRVDFDARRVTREKTEIPLTRTEFDLLALLLNDPGRVFSREELMKRIWGYERIPNSRTLDNHIFELRHKIEEDPSRPKWIQSIRGIGYRLTKT
jgi:DNA-binding response OmpR family regulator